MNEEKIQHFKGKLTEEKNRLENELQNLGRKLDDHGDWIAIPEVEEDGFRADKNENADQVEDFQERVAVLSVLEQQYADVIDALQKIAEGNYGICEETGHEISEDRLEANPSARTCIECAE